MLVRVSPKVRHVVFAIISLIVMAPSVLLAGDMAEAALDESLASSLRGFLDGGQLWLAFTAAFIGGVLTSLTPCVYPLIPITVRYFGAMNAPRRRVVVLASLYVLGMIVLYAVLGTIFAASNVVFGSFLANPWVVSGIAAFCIAMGASMLGAFTLQLPAGLNTKLSQVGGQGPGGAIAMGLVSGLIAAPCTGPVLAVILAVIASTGALFIGFWLMVFFGLGLGLPFLFLAIFSSRMPSGGYWMEVIKAILAAAMFIVAVYFLRFAWPGLAQLISDVPAPMWIGAVLIVAGLGFAAVMLNMLASGSARVPRLLAVFLTTVGVSLAIFGDGHSVAAGEEIAWLAGHDDGISRARQEGKPVMIDFTADWCQACKELDRETYVDTKVVAEAERFVNLKLDATEEDDAMNALFEKYKVLGLPTVVFIDSNGKILDDPRVTGFVPPKRFLKLMRAVQ